ncbi:MAG TPA: CU044_2847 family protein [Streptosporangiaceae bacterium]|nr:CU044_2847 family protein [Streptosporangiaceae bacterium]
MGRSIPVRVGDIDLLVEAEPVAGTEPTSRVDSAVNRVGDAYARAQRAIVEIASSTAESIEKAAARAARPDCLEIEFGLRFSVTGDVIVASAAGEATLKVRLTYQPGIAAASGGDVGTGARTGAGPQLPGP